MQFGGFKPSLGVIFNTTMSRPDSALALAVLMGFEGKREARVGAVAVSNSGLGGAAFADAVIRFYFVGAMPPNSNRLLPVGLAAEGSLPADPAMVQTALARVDDAGAPVYKRVVRKVHDTSEIPALIRNAITAQSEKNSVVVLSAPATHLARSLGLTGTRELAAARVKSLVVVDSPGYSQDAAAMRRVLELWPGQVVFLPRELGETVRFPGSAVEKDFAWAPSHPVVDAYRAAGSMPYDAPMWDVLAILYAVKPELFGIEQGTLSVGDDGRFGFASGGKHVRLSVDADKRDALVQTAVTLASAKPVVRQAPRPQAAAAAAAAATADPAAKK